MKITDYTILFIIIILPFVLIQNLRSDNIEETIYKKNQLNRALETSVQDGTADLIQIGRDKKVYANKDRAVNSFFNSLFINMNIFEDDTAQDLIKGYIPCIIVIDHDGYYVMNHQEYTNGDGYKEVKMTWNPKRYYSYKSNYSGLTIMFTLSNYITVYDGWDNFYQGTLDQIQDLIADGTLPSSDELMDDDYFEEVRKRCIVSYLMKDVNNSINSHNQVARDYGITYNFALPVIDKESWYRTIDDMGMLVFLQGLPIGVTNERFNSFSLGGARVVKPPLFYAEDMMVGTETIGYYHKENCGLLINRDHAYDDRKEAALDGYLPCKVCKP